MHGLNFKSMSIKAALSITRDRKPFMDGKHGILVNSIQ